MFKHFHCHAEIKSVPEASADGIRRIKGYASTKDLDRVKDVVLPSAFRETIDTFMKNPIVFFNHNWNEGIAKVTNLSIDENGLWVECEWPAKGTSQLADQVWSMIEQGIYRAFSFGFKILADQDVSKDPSTPADRIITKLDLLEVSVVTVPANANATFSLAKGLAWGTDVFPSSQMEQLVASAQEIQTKLGASIAALKGSTPEPTNAPSQSTEMEIKGTPKFADFPLADEGMPWDKSKAMRQIREWASSDGTGTPSTIDWNKFSQCFFWHDDANTDKITGYKLPFCFIVNGRPVAVPRGIFAAAAATRGARGGVSLPPADIKAVHAHIEKYYKKMGRPSPYEERSFDIDVEEFLQEVPDEKKWNAQWHLLVNHLLGLKSTLDTVDAQYQELKTEIESALAMNETPNTESPAQPDGGKGAVTEEPKAVIPAVKLADEALKNNLSPILAGLQDIVQLLSKKPN
jgi:HK97 family phage prohead protease